MPTASCPPGRIGKYCSTVQKTQASKTPTACPKGSSAQFCKVYKTAEPIYQSHKAAGCPGGIFHIVSGITCHISSGIASGLGGIGSLIQTAIFRDGLQQVLNSGSYQDIYGYMQGLALAAVIIVWLLAMIRSFLIRKQGFTKEPLRITAFSLGSVILIIFQVPTILTELLFYLSSEVAKFLFTVGFSSVIGSANLFSGNNAGVLRAVIEGGAFEILGGSIGWLFLIILMMLIMLWLLCIAVLVIAEAMGLFMLVLFPLAASTLAFSFGKRWVKELVSFISLAAFSQLVAVIVMLLSWVFLLISFAAATK